MLENQALEGELKNIFYDRNRCNWKIDNIISSLNACKIKIVLITTHSGHLSTIESSLACKHNNIISYFEIVTMPAMQF